MRAIKAFGKGTLRKIGIGKENEAPPPKKEAEKMRILFLDVDGVLNSEVTRGGGPAPSRTPGGGGEAGIASELVDNLHLVVAKTNATIIVSSTWRLVPDRMTALTGSLDKVGIKVAGATPDLAPTGAGDRVDEIMTWLDSAGPVEFVVVDDLDLAGMNGKLSQENFVKCDDAAGLTRQLAREAVIKLSMHLPAETRVIFLDIDGVLNSVASREAVGTPQQRPTLCLSNDVAGVDDQMLGYLQTIVQKTNAVVVLSSTWRLEPEKMEELADVLATRGIDLIGTTPDLSPSCGGDRVDEIREWLKEASCSDEIWVAEWIAIDDLNLTGMNKKMKPEYFVRTSDAVGLTAELAEEAIKKLSNQT